MSSDIDFGELHTVGLSKKVPVRSNAEPLVPLLAGTSGAVESGPLLSKHDAVARRGGTGSRAFSARRTMTAITIRRVAQQQSGPVPNFVGRRTDPRLARASLRGRCPGQRRGVPWAHMPRSPRPLLLPEHPWPRISAFAL